MTEHIALDPRRSVVVEACAGSGKTWLLVSRIVRLLLDGASPAQILAITFTRKAAQEMQLRLQQWLRDLAMGDEAFVRGFFAERGIAQLSDAQLQRARTLYRSVLLAQPGITISTFHGWFVQVLQRAPLNAGVMQGMGLLERAASTREEAWEALLEQLRKDPASKEAQFMLWLFAECGLFNTRKLLFNFLGKRSEWWAYTQGRNDVLGFSLEKLRADLAVDMDSDPVADWGALTENEVALLNFAHQLAENGTPTQQDKASQLECAWTDSTADERYDALSPLLYTQAGELRSLNPTKKQDAEAFLMARDALFDRVQAVRDALAEQQAYRLNEAVLCCGVAFLARYQTLKAQQQQMDFADLEWQLCRLLQQSEHAETMQYKLDSRYRHVLLDEFQDTNPLQWQILRAWFDAAVAVESQPTVFVVGDPKQSIYRFRRADARLFGVARDYLRANFAAETLGNSLTRRNAQPIVDAVNAVFREQPEGFEFVEHQTHQTDLPGQVMVLPLSIATAPLAVADSLPLPPGEGWGEGESVELVLRNPLTTAREDAEEGARHIEAVQFAGQLQAIVSNWVVQDAGVARRASYGDIMVLVRGRTHLAEYEEALRAKHIPFISSRRGGLLDTLEAEDVQALLTFLITPFADLALAQVLRTPIFACGDADLMRLAANDESNGAVRPERVEGQAVVQGSTGSPRTDMGQRVSWWQRLQQLESPSPELQRASELLQRWLALADKLPVHDLLDRIYFEGDVLARYSAVLPPEMRAKVGANLHAIMQMALDIDAGRYPSLPRFLQDLRELRDSSDDAPDEGKLGAVGDAIRIYTVHEAKGLEAPIVWLLDANAGQSKKDNNDVLLDWPTDAPQPLHFSLYTGLAARGKKRLPLFERDSAQQAREEMNLLYVAMTRARQALIISGNSGGEDKEEKKTEQSWYDRIATAVGQNDSNPPVLSLSNNEQMENCLSVRPATSPARMVDLPPMIPIGKRTGRNTSQQQRGIWLHGLLQHLTEHSPLPPGEGVRKFMPDQAALQQRLAIPDEDIEPLWQQAQQLLSLPKLAKFFDANQYRSAANEMPYINAAGEVKRIDRLVEFDDEVWVLDYKFGESAGASSHAAQIEEYRAAMQTVYAAKRVRCALVFAGGVLSEM
ncbi:MAG: UvrD-helicase domain-containing protein [Pseudomonadota bacterium]